MTTPALPEPDRVDAILREVAEADILPYFRQLTADQVRQKSRQDDLVTVADEAAERSLTRRLSALVPGSVVVGEEAVAADRGVLDRLFGDDPVWVIDPVDGTLNFASGRPAFAVIVAYVQGGETLAGWIHDPLGRRTAMGVRGQGAWMEGRRLSVAPPADVGSMIGAISTRFCDDSLSRRLKDRVQAIGRTSCLASAAHEYLRLLDGSYHCTAYHRLMPWDHAAGVLLHAEAGGYAALADGTPYAPTRFGGSLLMAPDAQSWTRLRDHLFG
ncbi:inositol monophosphatase family protein [Azospirillum halopraeferens]|uniref:inositol monophosphatase family protein n=1 Tax=Azospirillum halopraeferens TaxID=34010 RepID=UPI0003F913EF|nr:inositol monophosphatase [Azospirillum halopraeferens]